MTQEKAAATMREADAPLETVGRAEKMRRALAARYPGTYGPNAIPVADEERAARDRERSLIDCAARVVQSALDDAVAARSIPLMSGQQSSRDFAAELGRVARAAYDAFMVSLPNPVAEPARTSGAAPLASRTSAMRLSREEDGSVTVRIGAGVLGPVLIASATLNDLWMPVWEISAGESQLAELVPFSRP